MSGSVSICIASWILAICLSSPSFFWTICSICFFCCQITTPKTPKPISERTTMAPTMPAVFFRSFLCVAASTFFMVSAMMNIVWPEDRPPDPARAREILSCASLASATASWVGAG